MSGEEVGMRRAYKFLLRPTAQQVGALSAMLEDHRQLYNAALEERRTAWRTRRIATNYYTQQPQLTEIRKADPDGQGRWSCSAQQVTLRRLDKAFAAFFRRVKAGQKPGYPRFKGTGYFDTVEYARDGDGCRWDSTPHAPLTRVYFKGIGHVRVNQHRPVRGTVKTVSVKREGKRWFVVLSCEDIPVEALPQTGAAIGIDVGIAHFLTTSDGEHVANPRHGRRAASRLAAAQAALSRCKRGSNRRRKARERVAAIHAKVHRQRIDYAHKTALGLVRDHDIIAHEKLRVANMSRRPAPRPDGAGSHLPNGASVKAGLNRSINDAGWGVFLAILAHKAESAGRELIPVNPRNTSRACPECGHTAAENRVTQAAFRCVRCGHAAHADAVGALNVLRAGLARREAATA